MPPDLSRLLDRTARIGIATAALVAELSCPCGAEDTLLCPRCARSLEGPPWRADPACDALQVVDAVHLGADPTGVDFRSVMPVLAVGDYQEPLRSLILGWKNRGQYLRSRTLARALEPALDQLLARDRREQPATAPGRPVLVPVPSTTAHRLRRGEDHTALLAGHLAARSGARVRRLGSLHDSGQSGKGARDRRRRSGRGAAAPVLGPVHGPPVVLVDDVVTTGSTLRGLHDRLRGQGDRVIGAVVLAAARRSPDPVGGVGVRDCQDIPIGAWQNE